MAGSIRQLAEQAHILYKPDGVDVEMYAIWLLDGYRRFIQECGGVYTQTTELTLTKGTWEYSLPSDYRRLKSKGVYLYYAPRTISAISVTDTVCTVQTATTHALAADSEVTIADVTPVGPTTFDGTFTVASIPTTTTFTYTLSADDDEGSGGTVSSQHEDERFLSYTKEASVVGIIDWSRDEERPTYYFFPDAFNIGLRHVPNGEDPVLVLRYDAAATEPIDEATALPLPSYVEAGLIGYGKMRAAIHAGDDRMVGIAAAEWDDGKRLWNAARSKREQIDGRAGEEDDEPVVGARSLKVYWE